MSGVNKIKGLGSAFILDKFEEVPKTQRYVTRPSLRELFKEERIRDKGSRDKAIYKAHSHHGYTLREIGEYLGVHYATVSRALRRIERGQDECYNARPDPQTIKQFLHERSPHNLPQKQQLEDFHLP